MPRDPLDREQIVDAAVALLDAEGLEGLNMRALGERLGSAATAVYWHVGSKENLIALAADRAWHEVALPNPAASGWRDAAVAMASSVYAMLTRHPWLVQAFGSQPLYGLGKARHDEHSLAIYEAAGFEDPQADQAAASVFTFVLGNALGAAAAASLARKLHHTDDAERLMAKHLATARELASRFPRLRRRLDNASATEYGAAAEHSFEFGLHALLDGLQARLAQAPPNKAPARPDPTSAAVAPSAPKAPTTSQLTQKPSQPPTR